MVLGELGSCECSLTLARHSQPIDPGVDVAALGFEQLLLTTRNNGQLYRALDTSVGLGAWYSDSGGTSIGESGTAANW